MAVYPVHIGNLIRAFVEGVDLCVQQNEDDETGERVNVAHIDIRSPENLTIILDNGQLFNVAITAGIRQ